MISINFVFHPAFPAGLVSEAVEKDDEIRMDGAGDARDEDHDENLTQEGVEENGKKKEKKKAGAERDERSTPEISSNKSHLILSLRSQRSAAAAENELRDDDGNSSISSKDKLTAAGNYA